MSSFEIGASRPVGAVQSAPSNPVGNPSASTAAAPETAAATSAAPEVTNSLAVSAGTPPVDQDRVAQIRRAIQNGTYPVIPTRIGDAMIAAGVMLRKTS